MNCAFDTQNFIYLFACDIWPLMQAPDKQREMFDHLYVWEFSLEQEWNKLFDYSTSCILVGLKCTFVTTTNSSKCCGMSSARSC